MKEERFSASDLPLVLRHTFRIAHGASTRGDNVIVRIDDGYGEAALPPYYPTTRNDVLEYMERIRPILEDIPTSGPFPLTAFLAKLPETPPPACAAVDMALHDVWGKRLGFPLHVLFGLDPQSMPVSSYALPIPESLEELNGFLSEAEGFPFLKLKIGCGDVSFDEAIVRHTRCQYSGMLCVDVNAKWPIQTAVDMIKRLADCDLAFIEQPIPAEDPEEWHLLRRLLKGAPATLIADESLQTPDDILALAGAANGINIKLAKCGGIQPAREMISLARHLEMGVMLGCMIESSVAMTAAAHLGPLADWLDLDGPMHLAADPFSGLSFDKGLITLSDRPGIGVTPV